MELQEGVNLQEGVQMFQGLYWQIAMWVGGLSILFFIVAFTISKLKEHGRGKARKKESKKEIIM